MKYELETIPIWDTYKLNLECPLCRLEKQAHERYLKFFLGNSVMVPEMRVKVNKTGFCNTHFEDLLLSRKDPHGLGLITHTYLKEQMQKIMKDFEGLTANEKGRLFSKESLKSKVDKVIKRIQKKNSECMICDRIDYTLKRYAFTIVYLWKKDPEFRKAYSESKGFCLHHLPLILDLAKDVLSGNKHGEFLADTARLQQESLSRLEKELEWYTKKFDSQNADKPWGTSKDALHRTIQKLTGKENLP